MQGTMQLFDVTNKVKDDENHAMHDHLPRTRDEYEVTAVSDGDRTIGYILRTYYNEYDADCYETEFFDEYGQRVFIQED